MPNLHSHSYELKSQAVANEPNQLTPVSSQTTTPLQPEFTFCHHVLFCAHSKVKSKPIEKSKLKPYRSLNVIMLPVTFTIFLIFSQFQMFCSVRRSSNKSLSQLKIL